MDGRRITDTVSVVRTIATCTKVSTWWTLFILLTKSGIEDLPTYVEDYKYNKTCLNIFVSLKFSSLNLPRPTYFKILSHLDTKKFSMMNSPRVRPTTAPPMWPPTETSSVLFATKFQISIATNQTEKMIRGLFMCELYVYSSKYAFKLWSN